MYQFGKFLDHHVREIAKNNAIFFCGAGISVKSGIPSALTIVNDISSSLNIRQKDIDCIYDSSFPFEAFVETVAEGTEIDEILRVFMHGKPNSNHIFLAKLCKLGFVNTICTTNFDTLIESALKFEGLESGVDYDIYYNEDDFPSIDWYDKKIRLIKIHGCIQHKESIATTLRKVSSQILVEQRAEAIKRLFTSNIAPNNVIILGYSCSDIFDICPAIQAIDSHQNNVFNNSILKLLGGVTPFISSS